MIGGGCAKCEDSALIERCSKFAQLSDERCRRGTMFNSIHNRKRPIELTRTILTLLLAGCVPNSPPVTARTQLQAIATTAATVRPTPLVDAQSAPGARTQSAPNSANSPPAPTQIAASVAETPLSFKSVRELLQAKLAVATPVRVRGVLMRSECKPGTPEPCQFFVGDKRFAPANDSIPVFVPVELLQAPLPRVGDWVQITARIQPNPFAAGPRWTNRLRLLDRPQVESTNVAGTPASAEPTYTDGSWSVADLLNRSDLELDEVVTVVAYVSDVRLCSPCPKGFVCSPCPGESITISDAPDGVGANLVVLPSPGVEARRVVRGVVIGNRYEFTGMIADHVGFVWPQSGMCLEHKSHRAVARDFR